MNNPTQNTHPTNAPSASKNKKNKMAAAPAMTANNPTCSGSACGASAPAKQ